MGLFDYFKKENLNEEIKAFEERPKPKMTDILARKGEGWENTQDMYGVGNVGVQSFNLFYNTYINKQYENEVNKINFYRQMANMPEIADVIEDAVNESTQLDEDGVLLHLNIKDKSLSNNENIIKNLNNEFNELFNKNIKSEDDLWAMFRNYFIDGRIYYERIIDSRHPKQGIINIKILPGETMDYIYNPLSGKINCFFQYLKPNSKRPLSIEEAKTREDIILFNTNQIGFINYGIYGKSKYEIFGFLEKSKVPYNQLKLLETSVIIYRIIRAPERMVFRIDTGNMPRDKALKYVEKIKQKMTKKQSYNSTTGELSQEPEVLCIRKNTEIPLLDGRYLTLKEIIKEHNEGKENWVYTINQKTLDIEPGKIKQAKMTRKNEKLIRVWFDDKNYIDTTYDHKFILKDGSTLRADQLKIGQSMMPLYKKKVRMYGNLNYEQIYNPNSNKWIWTHKISTNKTAKNEVRHHKDFNRFNNNPSNLKIMDKIKHLKLHQDVLKEKWNEDNYDKQVELIRNGVKKWHSNPENKKRHSEWVIKTNIEQNKVKKMQDVLNTPEVRAKQKQAVKEYQIKKWSDPKERIRMKKIKSLLFDNKLIDKMCNIFLNNNRPKRDDLLKLLSENSNFMNYLKKINENQSFSNVQYNHINKQFLWKIIKFLGFNDYPEFKKNYALNHKVTKIEYLTEKDDTGCIEVNGNHNFAVSQNQKALVFIRNSMLENYYLPQSAEGRGSQIETVGGNAAGFTELDDIYYFARKLYRALKYPSSRVSAGQEKREADIMFGGGSTGEISRDEIKWSKFLERQQRKFCDELTDLFLLHLEFKGLKKQYGLDRRKIQVLMNPPSKYKEQMEANFIESRHNNYSSLADREEMSKYYAMRKYLKWTDEEIQANVEGMKKDIELGFREDTSGDSGY